MKTHLFLAILIGLLTGSCKSNKSDSTTLTSFDINDQTERIDILKREVKTFSELKDAEFYLINANGFSNQRITVPGASSLNYQFVIKIDTNDIPKWTEGMIEIPAYNINKDWLERIPSSRTENWKTYSVPKSYTRVGDSVMMVVYKDEGIIFKHLSSN